MQCLTREQEAPVYSNKFQGFPNSEPLIFMNTLWRREVSYFSSNKRAWPGSATGRQVGTARRCPCPLGGARRERACVLDLQPEAPKPVRLVRASALIWSLWFEILLCKHVSSFFGVLKKGSALIHTNTRIPNTRVAYNKGRGIWVLVTEERQVAQSTHTLEAWVVKDEVLRGWSFDPTWLVTEFTTSLKHCMLL